MLRKLSCFLLMLLAFLLLASCASMSSRASETVQVSFDRSAVPSSMLEFAANEIAYSIEATGLIMIDDDAVWKILFSGIDENLGEQAYEIEVLDKVISIKGGDLRGLMYGGLEVAEQIRLGKGLEAVCNTSEEPYILYRSIMPQVPVDMRSPSYTSTGDSGQLNIANVWNLDFWKRTFDDMAKNRFTTYMLRNLCLFPSMVQVEGYEEVALDDVWATTIPFDNSYSGNCSDVVRPEHWESYEIVKRITMDEKIIFWREVMAYAKSRGIDFIVEIGHLYTYAEHGKYGIDNNPDNEVTKDYYRKSMEAMIETYPDLYGVVVYPGENMGWDNSPEGYAKNMDWLHDVYVGAINEGLKNTPQRDFRLLLTCSVTEKIWKQFSDCLGTVDFVGDYTGVHMYATSEPKEWQKDVSTLPQDARIWLNFRNEDCFNMRWGDPDFIRDFMLNMPRERMAGFRTGSSGYFFGMDYSSTDSELYGKQHYLEKHWFNFLLIGRLSYDPKLSNERVFALFSDHFDGMKCISDLYEATAAAGKIIPQVHKIYYQDNGDYTWFVEGSWSHPSTFGYLDIKRWMKSNNTFPYGDAMSIEEYAVRVSSGETVNSDKQTPVQVSEALKGYSQKVLQLTSSIRNDVKVEKKLDIRGKDYWNLVSDNEAMAYLGLYYSEKILGAVDLRIFNETKDETYHESSVAHLEKALEHWNEYAAIISRNYVPQQLSRVGYFNVLEITKSVAEDIELARTWKPRDIQSSYHAPTKNDYFGNSK